MTTGTDQREARRTSQRGTQLTRRARAVVGVLIAAVVLLGCGADTSTDTPEAGPAAVIEAYRIAYNNHDIDAVMELFSEDSMLLGHPLVSRGTGLVALRDLHVDDMEAAAATDAYEISNLEASGATVTWDHVWTSDDGLTWCAEVHSATTADGRILQWDFAPDPHRCS